jgi:hypothetical protein
LSFLSPRSGRFWFLARVIKTGQQREFYGNQYASMAPLFEHYGVSLWMPEVGGRVDWHAEDHEQTMVALGLSSKREITRTRMLIDQLRADGTVLTYDPDGRTLRAGGHAAPSVTIGMHAAGTHSRQDRERRIA